MLRRFREFLQWRQGDCIILAEANVLPKTDMEYFGADGDRMHMMFNFQVNQHLFYALAAADTKSLKAALSKTKTRPSTAQWGIFLRNHDELDLGRLSERQRQTVFDAFGPKPRCSFMIAASGGAWLPCSMVIGGGWSWHTAFYLRCLGRLLSDTAMRSVW